LQQLSWHLALCIAGKVFARLLLPRVRQIDDRILPESQCGFRPSRSTSDMVFSLRQLQEKTVEQSRPLYVVFIDLTKSFDTVSRSGLYNILKLLGCPETLLSILVAFHENMKARVQFDGSMSKTFPICRGFKQGCVLAPTLFGIFFTALLAHAFPEEDGIMLHARSTGGLFNLSRLRAKPKNKRVLIRELLYADDAALVAHSEVHLQNLCERFAKACNDFSMTINLKKTVVMSLGTSIPPRILINGSPLNVVDKFSYLGSVVNSSNNLDDEINQRIGKASTNFGRLSSRVWKNHHLAIKLKIKVCTACILSVLLYSSESGCTYRRQENRLSAFHFRCLRSILDVSWRDHVPNSTILHLTGSYDLTTITRQRRLRWLGHVHRMEDGRLPKDILYGEFYNAPRRTGGPKLCHKDVIKRDMAGFDISPQSLETLGADRNRWRVSLSYGYSLSATSCAEKMEKRRAHR